MDYEERRNHGKSLFPAIFGGVVTCPKDEDIDPFVDGSIRGLMADTLARPGMSMRDRRLVILGALVAQGADVSLVEIHMRAALNLGELSEEEVFEVIMTLAPYAGYPKTTPVHQMFVKRLATQKPPAVQT